MSHREDLPYITAPDGTVYQVLNEAGTDWDEAATAAAYADAMAPKPAPKPAPEPDPAPEV